MGALDGWLVTAVHNFPSTSQRGAGDDDATSQDMLKVNKMIRSAQIDSVQVEGSQHSEQKGPVSILSWSSKKIKRVVRSSLAAETSSMGTCMEQLEWMRSLWSHMTTAEFSKNNYEGAFEKQPALLVANSTSLCDAIHKRGAAPSSADLRFAIELEFVKSRAMEGEADFLWIGARTVPDCRQSHEARIEEVRRGVATRSRSSGVADHRRGNHAGDTTGRERETPRRFHQEASEGGTR